MRLPASFRPAPNLPAQLTFALKREGVHLEFLARLFAALPPSELDTWVQSEPSGQYARRAGFFYAWLTGRTLDFPGVTVGNYVEALDPEAYIVASRSANNPRWRVRDNLPGVPDYCPTVLRTEKVREISAYDCARALHELEIEFGEDILMRSAVWLTAKESLASFAIEREEKQLDRVQRFAAVIERRSGVFLRPLDPDTLTRLQTEILGERALRYGLRESPVFVGEAHPGMPPVVHYIAPRWTHTARMLAGLQATLEHTAGAPAIVRAALASFGFVYIHPMADGNGRISRFLINDILRRDGAIPAPYILPVSATIVRSTRDRRNYDQVLEAFPKPLMALFADAYDFGPTQLADDGVPYNLRFSAYDEAMPTWRYPDLTEHTEYLGGVIRDTIEHEMREEATYLRALRIARARIKSVIEGPDSDIDAIIQSVRENRGSISNKLRRSLPALDDSTIGQAIVEIVADAFGNPTA